MLPSETETIYNAKLEAILKYVYFTPIVCDNSENP